MKLTIFELLKKSHFFNGLSSESQHKLSSIAHRRKIKKKSYIFHEGDKGEYIYFLRDGNIELFKTSYEGKKVVIKIISPGEMFAEVILFENPCYPVSAFALTESSVYSIKKIEFLNILESSEFRNDFITILMKKQRYLTERLIYLSTNDVEKRFFNFLFKNYGKKDRYDLKISKKDIAASIMTTPETLSRLLLRLKNEKIIEMKGKTIKIVARR